MDTSLARLSNAALLDELQRLAQREREATVTLVAHLAEVKKRKLYLAEGFSSMFKYCTQVLHFSEHATYLRLEAARMSLRFPATLVALESGGLHLTVIRLLAPYLTSANLDEMLAAARHRTRVEIEDFLARRFPRPDVPEVVRKLPARPAMPVNPGMLVQPAVMAAAKPVEASKAESLVQPTPSAAVPRPVIAPLAAERYKVQFTASAATHAKLRRAQDLLRHRIPSGDLSEIFDLALAALVEKVEKEKLAATDRPRPSKGTAANSRSIPANVKRAVWTRDGGQCAFIGGNRHRCAETGFLEFHHVVPFARGGAATTENIQLRCRAHNQFEAVLEFGPCDVVRESSAPWSDFREATVSWSGDVVHESGAEEQDSLWSPARRGEASSV